jgi:hypothetical protein
MVEGYEGNDELRRCTFALACHVLHVCAVAYRKLLLVRTCSVNLTMAVLQSGIELHCAFQHWVGHCIARIAQPRRGMVWLVCLAKVLELACCRASFYFDVAVTR